MHPYFDAVSLAAGGLGIAASVWYTRRRLHALRGLASDMAFREREVRFAAHELMVASRSSPQAVIDAIERTGKMLAPEIDGMLFAVANGDALVIEHAQGMHAAYMIGSRISLEGESPLAQAYRLGHRITAQDTPRLPLPGQRGFIAIPLVDVGRVIGVISLSSHDSDTISNSDALVTIVDLAVTAYQISLDRRANIHSATVDALTELLTPRAFRDQLFEEIADARIQNLPASLLFIDTDNFKSCNDTYGHAAGDVVLSSIAGILRREAGPEAIVGRNGGDEFCVLLHCGKASALRRAEMIRREVEHFPFKHQLGVVPQKPITLSIGVAGFSQDANDAAQLLERADAAMYHSKRSGRNMVSFITGDSRIVTLQQASEAA